MISWFIRFQLLFDQIGQLDGLEGHVGDTRFVEDAYRLLVDHGEAGIAPSCSFIQQQLVFTRPGQTTIQTGFDGDVLPIFGRVRIGEEQ